MRNKRGKVVSKRKSAFGKRSFKNIEEWVGSVTSARKSLQIQGFVAINGKSLQGKALYVKAKALVSSGSPAPAPARSPAPEPTPSPPRQPTPSSISAVP